MNLICPSHGVIWKENPSQIITKYLEWANNYQENQIIIIYDSMWNATRKMAETIASGILEADPTVTVKLLHAAKTDKNDIITEIFKSKAILVGSPTINNGYLYSIGGILEMIKGLKFKNKSAAAFGSYGWSGEVVKQINEELEKYGLHVINNGHRSLWVPDETELNICFDFGKELVSQLEIPEKIN